MNKTREEARSFLKKAASKETQFKEGFELLSPAKSPTIGIPVTVDLTNEEKVFIQKLLIDDFQPGRLSEKAVEQHVEQLTTLTKQIKSISAQSVLLHGERIKQAQDLLKDYREGCFSKWLMKIYGNRQTPYSMLRFYEFYQSAPQETRPIIETMPKKAVYLLASRAGDQQKKLDIVRNHSKSSQSDLVLLIQDTFPVETNNTRKPLNMTTLSVIEKACQKLEKRSKYLSDEDRSNIQQLIQRLQNLFEA